jgi:hypothetical protein
MCGIIFDRPKQRPVLIRAVSGGLEVLVDQGIGARVQGKVARLLAFAGDFQVRHAPARMSEIPNLELAQLRPPQRVIEERRQDRAIPLVLDGVLTGRAEQFAGLMVAERRRFALTALSPRPLDALDGVMGDGVLLAEVFEKRRERRQAMPDSRATQPRARSSRQAMTWALVTTRSSSGRAMPAKPMKS